VKYLHGRNLVHGDLKGVRQSTQGSPCFTHSFNVDPQANILITSDDPVRACLADFGFMAIVYEEDDVPGSTSALGGGTTPFMAPELLSPTLFKKAKCQVSKEADVYAFAMVILQVCDRFQRHLVAY
jgi:serine/threonine protein kinase